MLGCRLGLHLTDVSYYIALVCRVLNRHATEAYMLLSGPAVEACRFLSWHAGLCHSG